MVDDLDAGKFGKAIELVIAPSAEDITWSNIYDSIRTVYTHAEVRNRRVLPSARTATRARVIKGPSIGLEQYSCAGR